MKEDLDVSELVDAVERVQRGYRKPMPGMNARLNQSTNSQSSDDKQRLKTDSKS